MKEFDRLIPLTQFADYCNAKPYMDDILAIHHKFDYGELFQFPLRIDALLVILCRGGKGMMRMDMTDFEIKKDTLVVIQPQNFIHLFSMEESLEVDVVACSTDIIEQVLPKFSSLFPLILNHRKNPVTYLTPQEAQHIETSFLFLKEKLAEPDTFYKKERMVCLLQGALYEMMDIERNHWQPDMDTNQTRKEEILARFIKLVSANFREQRRVTYYSDKLGISSKHLSSVVKDLSHRTAGDWIEEYVTTEAKMLLRTTDLPVQDISDLLNFKNQSFFGKYFKYRTGMAPIEYRKQQIR